MIATGDERTYQWQRDGVELSETVKFVGVTGSMLMVVNAQNDDEDSYTCVVTNGAGDNVTSDAASLIVGKYKRERERQKCVLVQYVHVLVIRVNNNLLQKYNVATCTSLCSHSFHALFFS